MEKIFAILFLIQSLITHSMPCPVSTFPELLNFNLLLKYCQGKEYRVHIVFNTFVSLVQLCRKTFILRWKARQLCHVSEFCLYLFLFYFDILSTCFFFSTFWRISCILSSLSIVCMFTCDFRPSTTRVS